MDQELDLFALWQVIAKRWIMIVLIPLVAATASYVYSSLNYIPVYTASTTLIIMQPPEISAIFRQDLYLSRQLVDTYSDIMRSRRVRKAAAAKSDWPYGEGQMGGRISVSGVGETEIMRLSATDPDPEVARDVANVVAAAFKEEIIKIMNVENVTILDEAVTPEQPVNTILNRDIAVAFMVGLIGAVGLVFLIDYLDITIKDPAAARKLFDLPVIGIIPLVDKDPLFTANAPRSPPAEALRTLGTNIQYSSVDREIRIILVTGANQQCGKSTIAANLGITLARSSGSVLLVDADLRRPTQHSIFNIRNEPGLSNLIYKENLDTGTVINKSGYYNLSVLTSGPIPPYPAEMLASKRMKQLVNSFAEQFKFIIFDSPPLIPVTDAAVLSSLAEGTLFVIDYGRVRRDEAFDAMEHLRKVRANVIGTVFNAVPRNKAYYTGYSYYYGYDRADKNKEKRRK